MVSISSYFFVPIVMIGLLILLIILFNIYRGEHILKKSKMNYVKNKVSIAEHKSLGEDITEFDKNKDGFVMLSEIYPLTEDEVVDKIYSQDKEFSKDEFYKYVKIVFVRLMKSYMKSDVNLIRPYEANSLYYQDKCKIEDYSNNHIKRNISNIVIKGCLLKDYKIEGDNEIIVVALSCKMVDYAVDMISDCLIFGSSHDVVDNNYIMTFLRKKDRKKSSFDINNNICPNCGAKLSLSDDGICDYCETMLVLGDYYWVLVDIKSIKI